MSGIVAITGATGFVGAPLTAELQRRGRRVRRLLRTVPAAETDTMPMTAAAGVHVVGEIGPATDWSAALDGVDTLIHCAARVHVLRESPRSRQEGCQRVNRDATLQLAKAAALAGVRRLVFLSSIKVNGERTPAGRPFTPQTAPAPEDAYGLTKWQAEQGLMTLAANTGLEVVVIRPPLVHGPGVRANMLRLLRLVDRAVPLPFAAIRNHRSTLSLDNLIDLIVHCLDHPQAAGATLLPADDWDASTPELMAFLAEAMGRPSRLFSVPPSLLRAAAAVAGRSEEIRRLTESLQVDGRDALTQLGWLPPLQAREGLRRTVAWYRAQRR